MTSHFSVHSSYFIELRSILEIPASGYFTELLKARPELSFAGFNLKGYFSYLVCSILLDKKYENICLETLV